MIALILLGALTCDIAGAQAKVDMMQKLATEKTEMLESVARLTAEVQADQELIRYEKSNPGGVVDLHQLYILGREIQNDQEQIAHDRKVAALDELQIVKFSAEAKAALKGCKR